MQRWLAPQTVVQLPQWFASTRVLTHAPLHEVKPAGHAQSEFVQIWPASHLVPQPPQFCGLFVVLMHTGGSPQAVAFDGHAHAPAWQVRPPVHTTPHAPQFAWSVCVSTQAPAHAVCPVAQDVPHALCEQTCPV
jgi:hypothetical protein